MTSTVCIGLGSNLHRPIEQIQRAFTALTQIPATQVWKRSSLYRSAPVGPPDQPDYINAVAVLLTTLSPLILLEHLQAIEHQQGRVRTGERWGARTLDLDMLLYDNRQMQDPILTLPHPYLYERAFVLYPLYECLPALVLPNGHKLQDVVCRCATSGLSLVR